MKNQKKALIKLLKLQFWKVSDVDRWIGMVEKELQLKGFSRKHTKTWVPEFVMPSLQTFIVTFQLFPIAKTWRAATDRSPFACLNQVTKSRYERHAKRLNSHGPLSQIGKAFLKSKRNRKGLLRLWLLWSQWYYVRENPKWKLSHAIRSVSVATFCAVFETMFTTGSASVETFWAPLIFLFDRASESSVRHRVLCRGDFLVVPWAPHYMVFRLWRLCGFWNYF